MLLLGLGIGAEEATSVDFQLAGWVPARCGDGNRVSVYSSSSSLNCTFTPICVI